MNSSNPNGFQNTSSPWPPPAIPSYVGAQPVPTVDPPICTQTRTQVTWSTGLCDCSDDCSNCCMTCWCPCVTFGRIAEIVDRGQASCCACGALYTLICLLTGFHCICSCYYRSKMRQLYMLRGSCCGDCFVHWCCEPCALCQEYRELKYRGVDMIIGWQGNVERQNRGIEMPPVVPGGMMR